MFRRLIAIAVTSILASTVGAQAPAPVAVPSTVVQTPVPVVTPTIVTQAPSAPVVIYSSEPVVYSQPVIYSRFGVVQPARPQPARPQPAVGLGAVNSPFYFYPELTIGGPGYMYRSTPPHNGWSSGYRGAYYGEPVPGAAAWRRR